jgi:GNAT superfamily N-acetyltransferase
MALTISLAGPADLRRIAELETVTFEEYPIYLCLFPNKASEPRISAIHTMLRQQLQWDPSLKLLKVCTPEGKIVASGRWNVWPRERTQEELLRDRQLDWSSDCANDDWCVEYSTSLNETREGLIGKKPHILLRWIVTDPEYRRRGAATMIVKWGLDRADELGIPAILEATDEGKLVYEKVGFKPVVCASLLMMREFEGKQA